MASNSIMDYLKNVGESVKFAAIESVTEKTPNLRKVFSENNKKYIQEVYKDVNQHRQELNMIDRIRNATVFKQISVGWDNLKDSIKTGKFKDDSRSTGFDEMEMMFAMMGDDFLGGDSDLIESEMNGEETGSTNEHRVRGIPEITKGDALVATASATATRNAASSISKAIVRSAELTDMTARKSTNLQLRALQQQANILSGGFQQLSSSLHTINQFNEQVVLTHAQNSRMFYEQATQLAQERNAILKEMLEMQRETFGATMRSNLSSDANDLSKMSKIFDKEKGFDLRAYMNLMQKRMKETPIGMVMMSIKMLPMMIGEVVQNPLHYIAKMGIDSIIDNSLKKAIYNIDQSISGMISTGLTKLANYGKDKATKNTLLGQIAGFFGLRDENTRLSAVDTSKYNKEAMQWNGIAQKALVEVIPGHLRRIEAALTGEAERVFDLQSGKWSTMKNVANVEKDIDRKVFKETFSKEKNQLLNMMNFNSREDKRGWINALDNFFKGVKNRGMIDYNHIREKSSEYGDNENIVKAIAYLIHSGGLDSSQIFNLTNKINEGNAKKAAMIRNLNPSNQSLVTEAVNNSYNAKWAAGTGAQYKTITNEDGSTRTYQKADKNGRWTSLPINDLSKLTDTRGYTLYDYQYNIMNLLMDIRSGGGFGSGGGSGRNKRSKQKTIPSTFVPVQTGNPYEYTDEELDDLKTSPNRQHAANLVQKAQAKSESKRLLLHPDKSGLDEEVKLPFSIEDIKNANEEQLAAIISHMNFAGQTSKEYRANKKVDSSGGIFGNLKSAASGLGIDSLDSFMEDMQEATSIADKFNVVGEALRSMTSAPQKILTSVLTEADRFMYEFMFGNPAGTEKDENGQPIEGFFGKVTNEFGKTMNNLNNKFNEWFKDTFKKGAGGIAGFFKGVLEDYFDIDIDKKVENAERHVKKYANKVKKGALSAGADLFGIAKEAVLGTAQDMGIYEPDEEENQSSPPPTTAYRGIRKYDSKYGLGIVGPGEKIISPGRGKVLDNTTGYKGYLLHEGDSVIPSYLNPSNAGRGRVTSQSLESQARNENALKDRYMSGGSIPFVGTFAQGGTVRKKVGGWIDDLIDSENKEDNTPDLDKQKKSRGFFHNFRNWLTGYNEPEFNEDQIKMQEFIKNIVNSATKAAIEANGGMFEDEESKGKSITQAGFEMAGKLRKSKVDLNTNEFQEALKEVLAMSENIKDPDFRDTLQFILNTAGYKGEFDTVDESKKVRRSRRNNLFVGVNQFMDTAFGIDSQKAIKEADKTIRKNLPELAKGGTLGALLSTVLPLGGPLMGALVGAGASVLTNSKSFQSYMFGSEITDKDGNVIDRKNDGIVSRKTVKAIQRYMPDAKKYGITGAIAGLVLPFGPLGGLMLGAGASFLKNNSRFQEFMFGEEGGLINKDRKERIKKALPNIGVATLGTLFLGPFGIVGNAMLGAGLGILSTTESFKRIMLGAKDKNGVRRGGLADIIRRQITDPFKKTMDDAKTRLAAWFKDDLFNPLAKTIKPLARVMTGEVKDIARKAAEFVFGKKGENQKSIFGRLGLKSVDRMLGLVRNAGGLGAFGLQQIGNVIGKGAHWAEKNIGQKMEKRAFRKGYIEGDTTAQERLDRAEELGVNADDANQYALGGLDKTIANISAGPDSKTKLQDLSTAISMMQDHLNGTPQNINRQIVAEKDNIESMSEKAYQDYMRKNPNAKNPHDMHRTIEKFINKMNKIGASDDFDLELSKGEIAKELADSDLPEEVKDQLMAVWEESGSNIDKLRKSKAQLNINGGKDAYNYMERMAANALGYEGELSDEQKERIKKILQNPNALEAITQEQRLNKEKEANDDSVNSQLKKQLDNPADQLITNNQELQINELQVMNTTLSYISNLLAATSQEDKDKIIQEFQKTMDKYNGVAKSEKLQKTIEESKAYANSIAAQKDKDDFNTDIGAGANQKIYNDRKFNRENAYQNDRFVEIINREREEKAYLGENLDKYIESIEPEVWKLVINESTWDKFKRNAKELAKDLSDDITHISQQGYAALLTADLYAQDKVNKAANYVMDNKDEIANAPLVILNGVLDAIAKLGDSGIEQLAQLNAKLHGDFYETKENAITRTLGEFKSFDSLSDDEKAELTGKDKPEPNSIKAMNNTKTTSMVEDNGRVVFGDPNENKKQEENKNQEQPKKDEEPKEEPNALHRIQEGIKEKAKETKDEVKETLKDEVEKIKETTKELVVEPIKDAATKVKDELESLANSIKTTAQVFSKFGNPIENVEKDTHDQIDNKTDKNPPIATYGLPFFDTFAAGGIAAAAASSGGGSLMGSIFKGAVGGALDHFTGGDSKDKKEDSNNTKETQSKSTPQSPDISSNDIKSVGGLISSLVSKSSGGAPDINSKDNISYTSDADGNPIAITKGPDGTPMKVRNKDNAMIEEKHKKEFSFKERSANALEAIAASIGAKAKDAAGTLGKGAAKAGGGLFGGLLDSIGGILNMLCLGLPVGTMLIGALKSLPGKIFKFFGGKLFDKFKDKLPDSISKKIGKMLGRDEDDEDDEDEDDEDDSKSKDKKSKKKKDKKKSKKDKDDEESNSIKSEAKKKKKKNGKKKKKGKKADSVENNENENQQEESNSIKSEAKKKKKKKGKKSKNKKADSADSVENNENENQQEESNSIKSEAKKKKKKKGKKSKNKKADSADSVENNENENQQEESNSIKSEAKKKKKKKGKKKKQQSTKSNNKDSKEESNSIKSEAKKKKKKKKDKKKKSKGSNLVNGGLAALSTAASLIATNDNSLFGSILGFDDEDDEKEDDAKDSDENSEDDDEKEAEKPNHYANIFNNLSKIIDNSDKEEVDIDPYMAIMQSINSILLGDEEEENDEDDDDEEEEEEEEVKSKKKKKKNKKKSKKETNAIKEEAKKKKKKGKKKADSADSVENDENQQEESNSIKSEAKKKKKKKKKGKKSKNKKKKKSKSRSSIANIAESGGAAAAIIDILGPDDEEEEEENDGSNSIKDMIEEADFSTGTEKAKGRKKKGKASEVASKIDEMTNSSKAEQKSAVQMAIGKIKSTLQTVISAVGKWFPGKETATAIDTFCRKIIGKIATEQGEQAIAKAVAKQAASASAGAATMGIGTAVVTIGFAATEFIHGFNNASELFKIAEAVVTFGMRTLAGLVCAIHAALTSIPVVGIAVAIFVDPDKLLEDAIDIIGPAVGITRQDLDNLRKSGQDKIDQDVADAAEQTNLSPSYTDSIKAAAGSAVGMVVQGASSFAGILADKAKDAMSSIGDATGKAMSFAKDTAAGVGNWIKENASKGYQFLSDTASSAWQTAKNYGSKAYDTVASVVSGAKDKFSGLVSSAKSYASNLFGKGKNDQTDNGLFGTGIHSQLDPKIAGMPFNKAGDTEKQTVRDSACGPMAMANALEGLGYSINDTDILKKTLNGKETNGGMPDYVLSEYANRQGASTRNIGTSYQDLKESLMSGNPLVLMGQNNIGETDKDPFAENPHYVTAQGIDKDGYVTIKDPESYNPIKKYKLSDIAKTTTLATEVGKGKFGRSRYGKGPTLDENPPFGSIAAELAKRTGSKHPEFFWAQMMHETGGPENEKKWNAKHPEYGDIHNYGGFTWYSGMGEEYKGPPRPKSEGGYYAKFKSDAEYADMAFRKVYKSYANELAKCNTVEEFAAVLKKHGYYDDTEANYVACLNRWLNQYKGKLGNISGMSISGDASNTSASSNGTSSTGGKFGDNNGQSVAGFFKAISDSSKIIKSSIEAGTKRIFGKGKSKWGREKSNGTGEDIYAYLKSKGLSNQAIAGIMGNWYAESKWKSSLVECKKPPWREISSDTMTIDGNTGYGLAQWTYITRQQKLHEFMKSKGLQDSDYKGQIDFVFSGQDGDINPVIKSMDKMSPEEAAREFLDKYEHKILDTKNTERYHLSERQKAAKEVFEKQGKGMSGVSSLTGSSSGSSSNASADVQDEKETGIFGALAQLAKRVGSIINIFGSGDNGSSGGGSNSIGGGANVTEIADKIIKMANAYANSPITYAMTNPVAVPPAKGSCDCSGMAMSCYKAGGIDITRTADTQYEFFKKHNAIYKGDIKSLQPADLVFTRDSSGQIDHVFVYIGNGKAVNMGQNHRERGNLAGLNSAGGDAVYYNGWEKIQAGIDYHKGGAEFGSLTKLCSALGLGSSSSGGYHGGDKRSKTTRIIIHHTSGSKTSDPDPSAAEINKWHTAPPRNWNCIGYHYVIRKNGSIEKGRNEDEIGAHAEGANNDSIGIHVGGEFMYFKPTEKQIESLIKLIQQLCKKYNIPIDRKHILGHREVGQTDCPGDNLYNQLDSIVAKAAGSGKGKYRFGRGKPNVPSLIEKKSNSFGKGKSKYGRAGYLNSTGNVGFANYDYLKSNTINPPTNNSDYKFTNTDLTQKHLDAALKGETYQSRKDPITGKLLTAKDMETAAKAGVTQNVKKEDIKSLEEWNKAKEEGREVQVSAPENSVIDIAEQGKQESQTNLMDQFFGGVGEKLNAIEQKLAPIKSGILSKLGSVITEKFGKFSNLIGDPLGMFKGFFGSKDNSSSSSADGSHGGGGGTFNGDATAIPATGSAAAALKKALNCEITSQFGPRDGGVHHGIDYGIGTGTPVPTVTDGVIDDIGSQGGAGYGNYVVVKDKKGMYHIYAHLSKNDLAKKGDSVKAGQIIAKSGHSGHCIPDGPNGSHLHYGIYNNPNCAAGDGCINPNSYKIDGLSSSGQGKYGRGKLIKINPVKTKGSDRGGVDTKKYVPKSGRGKFKSTGLEDLDITRTATYPDFPKEAKSPDNNFGISDEMIKQSKFGQGKYGRGFDLNSVLNVLGTIAQFANLNRNPFIVGGGFAGNNAQQKPQNNIKQNQSKKKEVDKKLIAPNGLQYTQNDIDYILKNSDKFGGAKTIDDAIKILEKDKKYTEKQEDTKKQIAPNGLQYTQNDIDYILKNPNLFNGAKTEEDAIKILSKDKKYTEKPKDTKKEEKKTATQEQKETALKEYKKRIETFSNVPVAQQRLMLQMGLGPKVPQILLEEEEKEKQQTKEEKKENNAIAQEVKKAKEESKDKDAKSAPNGLQYTQNDIDYILKNSDKFGGAKTEEDAIKILSKDKKYTEKQEDTKKEEKKTATQEQKEAALKEYQRQVETFKNVPIAQQRLMAQMGIIPQVPDILKEETEQNKENKDVLEKQKEKAKTITKEKKDLGPFGGFANSIDKLEEVFGRIFGKKKKSNKKDEKKTGSESIDKAQKEAKEAKKAEASIDNKINEKDAQAKKNKYKEYFDKINDDTPIEDVKEMIKDIPKDGISKDNIIDWDNDDKSVIRAKAKAQLKAYNIKLEEDAKKKANENKTKNEEIKKDQNSITKAQDDSKFNLGQEGSHGEGPNGKKYTNNDIAYILKNSDKFGGAKTVEDAIKILEKDKKYTEKSEEAKKDDKPSPDSTDTGKTEKGETKENEKSKDGVTTSTQKSSQEASQPVSTQDKLDILIAAQNKTNELLSAILNMATKAVDAKQTDIKAAEKNTKAKDKKKLDETAAMTKLNYFYNNSMKNSGVDTSFFNPDSGDFIDISKRMQNIASM